VDKLATASFEQSAVVPLWNVAAAGIASDMPRIEVRKRRDADSRDKRLSRKALQDRFSCARIGYRSLPRHVDATLSRIVSRATAQP
jgi:hypothetical protein